MAATLQDRAQLEQSSVYCASTEWNEANFTEAGKDDGDSLFSKDGGHRDGDLSLISEEFAGQMLEK